MFQWCNALFISIFELIMMVKTGVNFMSFSNLTCHFRDTADFTVYTSGAAGAARAHGPGKTTNTAARRRCRPLFLFCKIEVRPRPSRPYRVRHRWRVAIISTVLTYSLKHWHPQNIHYKLYVIFPGSKYNTAFQIVMLDLGLLISLSIVFFPLTLLQTAVKEKKV